MQFAKVGDLTIHYKLVESTGPMIVYSNSLGTDFRIWDDVVAALGPGYGSLRYDKRGHGLSDLGEPPGMAGHVGDVAGLMDVLGIKSAVICGLSVGGMIAQGLFKARPDLVNSLILCDTGHVIGNAGIWNERIETVRSGGIAVMSDAILQRWFSKHYRAEETTALAAYRNMLCRTTAEGYARTSEAIRDTDFTQDAAQIAVPAMCVVGDEDGSTPPSLVKELASLIPNARYELINGVAHLPCIEQPSQLAGLIKDFISAQRV